MTSELFSSYGLVAGTEGTRHNPFEAIFTFVPSIAFLESPALGTYLITI